MSNSEPEGANIVQRVLAYVIVGIVILSLVCFAASMIGFFAGIFPDQATQGIWPAVVMLPQFGLPLALLLTLALLIVSAVRRSRMNGKS